MFVVAMHTRVLRPPFSGPLSGLFKPTLSPLFRFDTYRSKKESERLVHYLNAVPTGRILSVAVNDEGSRNLDDAARKAMTKLGSKHFLHLGFRYPHRSRPHQSPGPQSPPGPTGYLNVCSWPAARPIQCRPGEGRANAILHGAYLGPRVFLQSVFHSENTKDLCLHELIHSLSRLQNVSGNSAACKPSLR